MRYKNNTIAFSYGLIKISLWNHLLFNYYPSYVSQPNMLYCRENLAVKTTKLVFPLITTNSIMSLFATIGIILNPWITSHMTWKGPLPNSKCAAIWWIACHKPFSELLSFFTPSNKRTWLRCSMAGAAMKTLQAQWDFQWYYNNRLTHCVQK